LILLRTSVCWAAIWAVSGEAMAIGQRASLRFGSALICTLTSLVRRLT
jgi:hypothetical protein